MSKDWNGFEKSFAIANYLEEHKAEHLQSHPRMNDLVKLLSAKFGCKITNGQLKAAMKQVHGFTAFRGQDKASAFSEMQKTCNHMIGWIIKLMECGELPKWAVDDLRDDELLPEEIRTAVPRTTLQVKRNGTDG